MKQFITGPSVPTAQICINKSRLKVYNKETAPTYYLTKGQEFQIELFNPTKDVILAKIYLNGKAISQGGLVLRPAERVFLERYLDIAKKFLFDTYEVAKTAEAQKAIEDNGDFKVEFFRESSPVYGYVALTTHTTPIILNGGSGGWGGSYTTTGSANLLNLRGTSDVKGLASTANVSSYSNTSNYTPNVSLDQMMENLKGQETLSRNLSNKKRSKTIETGRVEAGSQSSQRIETVNKTFDYYPFYTTEYKLLPLSEKVNTLEDINVKRYCHNCGSKQKPEFKFCPSCGAKC